MNKSKEQLNKLTDTKHTATKDKRELVFALEYILKNLTYKNILQCKLTNCAIKRILEGDAKERVEIIEEIASFHELNLLNFLHMLEDKIPNALSIICKD